MKRKELTQLVDWYESKDKNPLLLTGAKGVGKTRLLYDFLENYPGEKLYLNLELNPRLNSLFPLPIQSVIINNLIDFFKLDHTKEILIIFDEFTYCSVLTQALETNQFESDTIRFLLISSFHDLKIEKIPARFIRLGPMEFDEFLDAINKEWYIDVIEEHFQSGKPIPDIVHQELLRLFDDYITVGGMPLAVNEYIALESVLNVSEQHQILSDHILYTLKCHVRECDAIKMCQIYDVIDLQLAKSNKKFQYNVIRKGVTKRMYETSISTMVENQLLLRCNRFGSNVQEEGSKFYLLDCGLLLSKYKQRVCSTTVELDSELYKGLLENYVAQSLHRKGYDLFYWESKTEARIEFILDQGTEYIPIEIRPNKKLLRTKAVHCFRQQYDIKKQYKISPRNFERKKGTVYIPFYAVFCI